MQKTNHTKRILLRKTARTMLATLLILAATTFGGYYAQSQSAQAQASAVAVLQVAPKAAAKVWIPTRGGKKYHTRKNCSSMKGPSYVTLKVAKARGFTACKKCY